MGKPKKSGSGFSSPNSTGTKKKQLHLKRQLDTALQLAQQGEFQQALTLCQQILTTSPQNPDVLGLLGAIQHTTGNCNAAIASLQQSLSIQPNNPAALANLGLAYRAIGDLDGSINSFNNALKLNPNYPEAHNNLGNALKDQGDLAAAIDCFNTALKLNPNYPEAHNNLGIALKDQGDLTAAIASFNTAIKLKPNYPEAHNDLGIALKDQGDLTAAIASFNTAIKLKPNYPEAHLNLSFSLLLNDDYQSGWEEYEYRFQIKTKREILIGQPNCPLWDGTPLKPNDQLLLVSEQGLGDTLHFMRYALHLHRQSIDVSLCAPSKLYSLIQKSGLDPSPLTPEQANDVTKGYWMPLLSLPKHLEVNSENPVITEPYIKSTDELIRKWEIVFAKEQRPIIGINWKGNRNDNMKKERNIALEEFAALSKSDDITLLSLQRGATSEEIESCSFSTSFVKEQPNIHQIANSDLDSDFIEYAAIIANCDLIITTGTTLAHLAGGMGKKTWTIIPNSPEWRWGLEGETSFWYPSMRLFRQTEQGNWNKIFEQLAGELKKHFEMLPMNSMITQI